MSIIVQFTMTLAPDIVCKNIKIHAKITNKENYIAFITSDSSFITKRTASFVVVRLPLTHCVYSCYYSGHINVTGISSFEHIKIELNRFCTTARLQQHDIRQITIDNITAVIHPTNISRVSLYDLITHITNSKYDEVKSLKYNNQVFPGLFIKTSSGTIIWFNSNAISCVGSKSIEQLTELRDLILRISTEYANVSRKNNHGVL